MKVSLTDPTVNAPVRLGSSSHPANQGLVAPGKHTPYPLSVPAGLLGILVSGGGGEPLGGILALQALEGTPPPPQVHLGQVMLEEQSEEASQRRRCGEGPVSSRSQGRGRSKLAGG